MFRRFRQILRGETWQETINRLAKELVPIEGEAETLQGELIRCVNNLNDEATRNGWMNWDEGDLESVEVLRHYLPTSDSFSEPKRQQIHSALDKVVYAGERGADEGDFGYAELRFIAQCVAEWCNDHKKLIYKQPEATWLDQNP